MEQSGTELCSRGLADLGGGGLAGSGRCGLGESAAGCAAGRCGSAARSCELELSARLRGGGSDAGSDAGSQQSLGERPAAQEDYLCATQAYNGSSDEDDAAPAVGKVIKINNGQDGESYELPGGGRVDVLAFGRQQQDGRRDGLRVFTVTLVPETSLDSPAVSRLQAEIVRDGDGLRFKSMGQAFNHINDMPLHSSAARYEKSALRVMDNLAFRPDSEALFS